MFLTFHVKFEFNFISVILSHNHKDEYQAYIFHLYATIDLTQVKSLSNVYVLFKEESVSFKSVHLTFNLFHFNI